jgi:hypothetical protein
MSGLDGGGASHPHKSQSLQETKIPLTTAMNRINQDFAVNGHALRLASGIIEVVCLFIRHPFDQFNSEHFHHFDSPSHVSCHKEPCLLSHGVLSMMARYLRKH